MEHTPKNITHYLEQLVLQRFSLEELHSKIKNDFQLKEFSLIENDCETLESDDESFIFTLTFESLLVDVTLYCLDTNVKNIFIVTEVSYDF